MRHAVAHRRDSGVDDVRRRVEVGLADLEMHDVPAGALERLRTREHAERRLGAEALESRCQSRAHSPLRVAFAFSRYAAGNGLTDVQPPST